MSSRSETRSRSESSSGNPLLRWHDNLAGIAGCLIIRGMKRKMSKTEMIKHASLLRQIADEMEEFAK